MFFHDSAQEVIERLDRDFDLVVAEAERLRSEHIAETSAADWYNYRVFGIRKQKKSLVIEWRKVIFSENKRMRNPLRINLGETPFHQAPKFMGKLDQNHLRMFHKYEPQLAVLREVGTRNRQARVAVEQLMMAAKKNRA